MQVACSVDLHEPRCGYSITIHSPTPLFFIVSSPSEMESICLPTAHLANLHRPHRRDWSAVCTCASIHTFIFEPCLHDMNKESFLSKRRISWTNLLLNIWRHSTLAIRKVEKATRRSGSTQTSIRNTLRNSTVMAPMDQLLTHYMRWVIYFFHVVLW